MSVHAGTILHIGGDNVIDRIQSAGLGDVRVPTEVIREVGNELVVDKVPGDPDFTFTLETLDVTTELEAWLAGGVGAAASASSPGAGDPDGTPYVFSDFGFVNIPSPWKDTKTGSAGTVVAGHLIPGYYPRRIRYRFGVGENSSETVELAGGAFYYAAYAPVEDFFTGDGSDATWATTRQAIPHRKGGYLGTEYKGVWGVIVDGELQSEGVDYTQNDLGGNPGTVTVTFMADSIPASGANIRFVYFTDAATAYPQARHASTVVKPAAVRGRHICIFLGSGGARAKVGAVQTFELEASQDTTTDRELCSEEVSGFTVQGRDVTGTMVVRSKNPDEFINLLSKVTGVPIDEVFGYLNTYEIPLEVQILNPRDPATVIKTLYVSDAKFQPPGTNPRVNTPTDFSFAWESATGDYTVFKGEM